MIGSWSTKTDYGRATCDRCEWRAKITKTNTGQRVQARKHAAANPGHVTVALVATSVRYVVEPRRVRP